MPVRARPIPEEESCAHPFRALPCRALPLCGGLADTPAVAQETMKMNISIGQNSHQGVAIDTFAKEVEKRTNGRYKIQNFYSGALGGERESIEAVQLGTQDLTITSTGPVPNFVPEARDPRHPVPVPRLRRMRAPCSTARSARTC